MDIGKVFIIILLLSIPFVLYVSVRAMFAKNLKVMLMAIGLLILLIFIFLVTVISRISING